MLARNLAAGHQLDSTGENQQESLTSGLTLYLWWKASPSQTQNLMFWRGGECQQFSYFSLGPTLLIQWLLSERHTRLSNYFLKNTIFRLRYSNHHANGIVEGHYKILSKLSQHASKSKKINILSLHSWEGKLIYTETFSKAGSDCPDTTPNGSIICLPKIIHHMPKSGRHKDNYMTLAKPICLLINGKMRTMQIKVKFNGHSELW